MKIRIETHYAKDDPDFSGDHYGGEIFVNGTHFDTFPDNYHENRDYLDGLLDGIALGLGVEASALDVERVGVADGQQVW